MMNHNVWNSMLLTVCLSASISTCRGDDWPQWRGANRMDISSESGLLPNWPPDGPTRVWLFEDAGVGYSGPAIVDGRLFTMGTRDDETILLALDASTGQQLWVTSMGETLNNNWGDGPRATPTIDGEHVYAMSGEGRLMCCQRENGDVVWQRDMTEFGGRVPVWGYCESVLVHGSHVICTPGGSDGTMVALDKSNGDLNWQSADIDDLSQYSSPILVNHAGQTQYVQLTKSHVFGVAAGDGRLIWSADWPGRTAVIPTPIFNDGHVYVTSGYGVGCKLVSLKEGAADVVYENKTMKNHHGGVILIDGHIYGYSDNLGWTCQNFFTGELVWQDKDSLGKGCITSADGMLYCVGEKDGEVVLIKASTDGWLEHGRFTLDPQTRIRKPKGKIWTHPVISNGKMYLRDQNLIYCYDIRE